MLKLIDFFNSIKKSASDALLSFFRTKAVLKLLLLIFAFTGLVQFIKWLPTLQVKRGPMPVRIHPGQPDFLGEIAKDSGLTLAAANGGKRLYIDSETMNVSVVDDESGRTWNAFRTGEGGSAEDMSLFRLSFLSEDNIISNWNSYSYSQKDGNFTIRKIRNGVRLDVRIGDGDPTDINMFMPRRIAIDRYERTFLRGLDEITAQGVISETEAFRYKSVLDLIYDKDEANGFYFNKLGSSPPGSAVQQMLRMSRLLEYTVEQLAADEAPYDLPAEDRRPAAGFLIPIDFALNEGDLTVSISTENIGVENDFYTLTRIHLMPNFGSVSAAESESGYIFVPDGSGALIALNSFDPSYSVYERPLYWNTVFRDKDTMPQFPEDLKLPVFGMIYGAGGGFMGIVEKGDETAFIGARAASPRLSSSGDLYNTVYSGFDTAQFMQIGIAGAALNGGSYAVGTGILEMDFAVRYRLFGDAVSYFDMASVYREYLAAQYGLVPDYSASPEIYLDVAGALTAEGRFLGAAYERTVSMTGYSALAEILQDLRDVPGAVSYSGVFNGGMDNRLANRAVLIPQNGRPADLENLLKLADSMGKELYLGTNIARIYKPSKNGYSSRIHAAQGYDGEPAFFTASYDAPTRRIESFSSWYNLLNPLYLSNVLDGFLAGASNYDKIYVYDLGSDYYASYKRRAVVPPLAARIIVDESLMRLGTGKTLALNNPSADKIPYAAWAVDVSRESSNYGGFYTSIPFRQLVMNGFIRYTTLNVNMSGESQDYYLLQALELGSVPKFRITAENADALKYTQHTEYLSTRYAVHKDGIKRLYRQWAEAFGKIGSAEIVNHETLGKRVYKTSYRNGVSVTVNYNRFAVETGDGEHLPPLGYIIREDGNEVF